jgi:hypothetical protein
MRILQSSAIACFASLWLAGCPSDDATDDGAETGAATTTPSTTNEPGTATETDTAGPGATCGNAECSQDQWCNFTDGICGTDRFGMASCEPRPEACPENYAPVCGCDGQVHSNACAANMAGVDLDASGDCETPSGFFRCGDRFCDLGFEYCQVQGSDVGGFGHGYACISPAACADQVITCDCLTEEVCFEFGCSPTADGGVEIVCPGG